ncbi:DUF1858 domain-containing protein [Vagococcus vulneris]|uniref:DUF1858 domain-containing protein n=1 Tax=Vagococcus vulneris TaxID=1977869 RepID=A0A430A2A3_9ENTE|nr:DUF1858 domain-containing protein [Vagococcus vulneris]RSU00542.1 hypothetical protein CBF37_00575 [Vagococcus vulneris]
MIVIDLNENLYDTVKKYPEVIEIMYSLGFKAIAQPGMLQTAGRYMTIKKGAQMKKIELKKVIEVFQKNGFIVEGYN